MLKKLAFGLLPISAILMTLAKFSEFSGNEAIFWIGFALLIPFFILIGRKIIENLLQA